MNQKNDFKAFSFGKNANALSQIDYEINKNLQDGIPPGDITPHIHLLNKVLRQSSAISSVVADFIATQSGEDVLDDGERDKLIVQLNKALEKVTTAKIPNASLTQKGIVQLTNEVGNNDTLAVTQKLAQEIINSLRENINERVPNTRKINGKVLTEDISINAEDVGAISTDNVIHSMAHGDLDKLENLRNGCCGFNRSAPFLTQYGLPRDNGGVQLRISNMSGESNEGEDDVWSHRLIFAHFGDTYRTDHINEYYKLTRKFWDNINAKPDFNGYLKISSPIIEIYPDGTFSTNEESAGAEVTKEGIGIYRVSNISGYNTDGAWGVHGGISVPQNNNNLELIFVGDHIQPDGSIMIEVCHRQHSHLPEKFQNWRLKSVDGNGKQVFYQDGEPCDIPEHCRLDIRVQMPEDSLWNLKRNKLQEEIESTRISDDKL
ncbi:Phage tail fiber repeat protein [Photorhabdus australis subsp. thailandensis]|uniref:Phage tail fiber repeat protein n=1 Tax=Photorhabdus australis subsp. thailandensis TaxID=2805096 RepID=A0A1C0U1P0_9GAMM|nr:tail fiber protein [Photorhabdus australis]OCQ51786.1 Phage tail fiber repeat protein [Photorhabdus australis subsp. thailandensis]